MGDRRAQEFWDQTWYWERYERYPTEPIDDPHLVVELASEVERAGDNRDPQLWRRYNACVGRVLQRLTDSFPVSGEGLDEAELRHSLAFGLRAGVRGHDAAVEPIIDANSLVIFRFFVSHAILYCQRHGLSDLERTWTVVGRIAEQVDREHRGAERPSRFAIADRSPKSG